MKVQLETTYPDSIPFPPRSVLHLAPELLEEIFSYFGVNSNCPDETGPKGQLFSISLTCKRFLEPGLNVLWRHIDALLPLLKILPTFQNNASRDIYVSPRCPESST
jgi:hypothetical protein